MTTIGAKAVSRRRVIVMLRGREKDVINILDEPAPQ